LAVSYPQKEILVKRLFLLLAGQTLHGVQKRITDVIGRPFRVIPDIRH